MKGHFAQVSFVNKRTDDCYQMSQYIQRTKFVGGKLQLLSVEIGQHTAVAGGHADQKQKQGRAVDGGLAQCHRHPVAGHTPVGDDGERRFVDKGRHHRNGNREHRIQVKHLHSTEIVVGDGTKNGGGQTSTKTEHPRGRLDGALG